MTDVTSGSTQQPRRLPVVNETQDREGDPTLASRGDDGSVVFRDPTPPDAQAHALRDAIAQALLRVPTVPVELPKFQLSLQDLIADREGIELVLGSPDPVARVKIRFAKQAEKADVRAVPVIAWKPQTARGIEVLVERLRVAITRERWDSVKDNVKTLARLPLGVPLGFFRQRVAGVAQATGLVRTGFDCNQDCGMCWQGRSWGRFGPEAIHRWIEDLAAAKIQTLILSGGEPMLDQQLPEYIRLARSLGMRVVLESNAMLAARAGYAQTLRDAGLDSAFISLHSSDAAVSDAITRAPGTHALTVKGIHALLAAGVDVTLNAVMTAEGLSTLSALPDFVRNEFGTHAGLRAVMISYPTQPFDPALLPKVMPDPLQLRAQLRVAIDRAFALGLPLTDLGGPCGAPLCLFDADPRACTRETIPGEVPFRRYVPACDRCAVKRACFGVRHTDVELFGADWVHPIESE